MKTIFFYYLTIIFQPVIIKMLHVSIRMIDCLSYLGLMCSLCLLDRSSLLPDNLWSLRYHATHARIYRIAARGRKFFFCRDLDMIIRGNRWGNTYETFAYFHIVHLLLKFMTYTNCKTPFSGSTAIINPL